jgi:hypothetical protein
MKRPLSYTMAKESVIEELRCNMFVRADPISGKGSISGGGVTAGQSDVVHCAGGLFTTRIVTTRWTEFVFWLGVFARFVHSFFAGILGDVFYAL